ncbi:MAG: branched-chain amino acid ABC transporter permease [Thermoplasmata archaeon]|nr:branched-chain amino acid ABC transporter permease [Thermoplasmata archaeon]
MASVDSAIAIILVYGAVGGAIYALISLGFTLIFGVARLLNLVYGALYMVVGYTIYALAVQDGVSIYAAAAVAIAIAIGVGTVSFLLFVRRNPDPIRFMIGTLLIALFLQYYFSYAFQGEAGYIIPGLIPNTSILVMGVSISQLSLLAAGVSVIMVVTLYIWVERTGSGRVLRATASDPETAALFGISPGRVALLVIVLSSALIGLAAVLVVPTGEVTPTMWTGPFIIAFVVAIVGGLGKFLWTLPAAFLVSFSQVTAQYYIPYDVTDLVAFAVAIVFILTLPRGMGGIWEAHRVG